MRPDEHVSADLRLIDFMRSSAAERAGLAFPQPTEAILANIRKVAAKVQQAIEIWQVQVVLSNGWRPTSPDINGLVGGSSTSAHTEALAADLRLLGGVPLDKALRQLTDHATFMEDVDQLIIERGCLHLGLPCKASGYQARRQVRTETWTFDQKLNKSIRHYPLLFIWKPKEQAHA